MASVWDETKHPRGKGEHGGEWVKKLSDAIDGKHGGGDPLTGDEAYMSVPAAHELPNYDKKATRAYISGSYQQINGYNRHGPESQLPQDREILKQRSETLDSMIKSAPPLKHDIEVERGVSGADDVFGPLGSRTGKVFIDKGFTSTSTDPNAKYTFTRKVDRAHIKIRIPAGSHVLRMEAKPGDDSEKEILLNRGSRFRVISDKLHDDYEIRLIELELL